jgi:hypothetical protein
MVHRGFAGSSFLWGKDCPLQKESQNPNRCVRVRSHFSRQNGKIFLTTVFQVLRMMGKQMEDVCHISENDYTQPKDEEAHYVNGVGRCKP